ncbi:twin-arginine translocation signal domain-containing protein [Verticiella sediminum]|uniref:Twin-arginine translocation signal domain-containing protein n=1 Tax=Verticiella sediminum TaxID=1247510 RepID=A0A556AW40_9BURK|nr:ABC transporter substrate-binding protein [Verticiella sediminum]TSH97173.1 twin-arginine translocation signal domain-containing protein [Verticiella sediminum]
MFERRDFLKGAVGAAALGVGGLPAWARAAQGPLRIAYPIDVRGWDPGAVVSPNAVPLYKCIFDQPLEYTAQSRLVPGLLSGYRWRDTAGLALELTLRDGVTFHDGSPLTSADIAYTFHERLKAKPDLQAAFIWNTLASVETPSPTVAVMHFSRPMVTAPQFLAYAGAFVLPKSYIEKVGLEGFLARPIGSGPYRLVEYERDNRIVLEAYPGYWREPASVPNVVIQLVPDATARVAGLQAGHLNLASGIPVREAIRLDKMPTLQASLTPTVDSYLIHMVNVPALQDRRVRLALHHAIDKEALSKAFFNGVAAPMATPAAPGTPAFDPDFTFAHAPERASALLAEAGHGPDNPLRIPFYATSGAYPSDYDMARAIAQMWRRVGVEADLRVIEIPQYHQRVQAGKLDGPALWLWTNATGDPELSAGYYLDPRKIFSVWRSEDVSARLDPLLVELDEERRIAGYRAFHAWVVGEGYALPLLQGLSSVVSAPSAVRYAAYRNGWILPYAWTPA